MKKIFISFLLTLLIYTSASARSERLYDPILRSTGAVWIDSRSKTGTFEQLIDTLGVTPVTLVINTAESVVANLTIPSTIQLHFTQNGSLAVAVTKNIDIQTTAITAGEYPIFSGAGDFDFAAGTKLSIAWFASLANAITYIATDRVTLEVLSDLAVTVNSTFLPSSVISVPNAGVTITVATGITMTAGNFTAGDYPVFVLAGTGLAKLKNQVVQAVWFAEGGTGTKTDPWINGVQGAVVAARTNQTQAAVETFGFFEIDSPIIPGEFQTGINMSLKSRAVMKTRIYLKDNSDCVMLDYTDGANQQFEISGIEFDGNKANNAGVSNVFQTNNYNFVVKNCTFRNARGNGLYLYSSATADPINQGPTSVSLIRNRYQGNSINGLYIYLDDDADNNGTINVIGYGLVEDNSQCGIKIESDRTISDYAKWGTALTINIQQQYFESNNTDDNQFQDILVDAWRCVYIHENHFRPVETPMISVQYRNGARDGSVYNNSFTHPSSGANEDIYHGIKFDSNTRRNTYWGNKTQYSVAQSNLGEGGEGMLHIYDGGVNTCLDPTPNITRGPYTGFEHDRYCELTGNTGSALGDTIFRNHILYSEDLTQAEWVVVGADMSVVQEAVPSSGYLPHGVAGNLSKIVQVDNPSWITGVQVYQDVSMAGVYEVKTGDLITFSIFVFMDATGATDKGTINIGVGKDDNAFEDSVMWDSRQINIAAEQGFKRIYVTTVATENAAVIRCKLRPVANFQTLKVWGAQLNFGKMKPYFPTGANLSQAYPGLVTSHLTAYNGVSLGSYSAGSGTTASLKSWQGKYQSFTHTGSITELSLIPGASTEGSEIVLKLIQSGAGARTLTSSTVKFIGGGAQNLTGTAAAVDIFTFGYSGSTWYQTCPVALDVK